VYALATATLLLTGVRQGELLALRRMNIDLRARTVNITHVIYRGRLLEVSMNNTGGSGVRHVGMSDLLLAVLQTVLNHSPFKEPTSFVFFREDGSPLDPDFYRRHVLYPALDRIGISRGNGTHGLQMLRYTVGNEIHRTTGDVRLVQDQLGHTRIQTSDDTYPRSDGPQIQEAADALAKSFAKLGTLL